MDNMLQQEGGGIKNLSKYLCNTYFLPKGGQRHVKGDIVNQVSQSDKEAYAN